ncbi:tripartite motif-containing protein 72-like [Mercenaria mercenaria]|uniref:tripartite motif-containing protein 72-like n=1 Tax=Mercenaria mercenaria TaxID=6596 RepID=UPI00234EC173|nr:tripartite motif-containing protein 72-like [Mercenaria mercenaria]
MASSHIQTSSENTGLCCCICLDQYQDPRSLACLHTFCESCINDCVIKQQSCGTNKIGIECPLCRKVTRVKDINIPPKLWSKTIPVNYALQEVIETRTRDKATKDVTEEAICNVHGKLIEFYCGDEMSLCCSTCAIKKLKEGKEVNDINEIADGEIETRSRPLQKHIYDLLLKTNNTKRFLDQKEMDLENQVSLIDTEMKNIQERIEEKIDDSRALVMSEATFIKDKALKQYATQRKNVEKQSAELEQAKHSLNKAIQNKTKVKTFIAVHTLEGKVNQLEANFKEQQEQISFSDIRFNMDKIVHLALDDNNLCLGKLKTEEVKLVESELKDCRKIKLKKLVILDVLTCKTDEKQPLYSGMEFLPDNRLVLVDNANWKCLILSRKLDVIGKHQFSSHIFDIISTSNHEIFVTGAKRLEKVLIDSEIGFANVETVPLESCPFSISVLSDKKFVIGTYRSSTPARILTKSGTEVDFTIDFPKKYWKIDDSRCAYDSNENILTLTDRYDNCVYIYDTKIHNEIRVKDKRIVEPRGVAFGPYGCIFVCSRGTNSIVQLSRFGEVLGDHALDMIYPCTICFSKDNRKVAVSNSYGEAKQLQIFQICSLE